ncbi:MAG: DUF4388 domain-containing protein [bacterium]|nr:DUF4388 domain-containing protein [bacterium]
MPTATGSKSMELEGSLGAFQLPDILRFLAMGRMSGTLTLTSEGRTVQLSIKDGMLVGSASSDRQLRLGEMLVYEGRLSRRQLDEVLDGQQAGASRMLGEILIERQLVPAEPVKATLELQVKEELWELFAWTDGTFKFEHGLPAAYNRPLIALEIEPLIEEGIQRKEQWQKLASSLGGEHEVFRVRGDVATPPETRLTANDWRVLSLINGRHTVRILIYLTGLGKFETLRAIDKLLGMQLVEPVDITEERPVPAAGGALKIMRRAGGDAPERERSGSASATSPATPRTNGRGDGRRRSILGFGRRGSAVHAGEPTGGAAPAAPPPPPRQVGPFFTCVGLACAVVNRLIERLTMEVEFQTAGGAAGLCRTLWSEIGMRYPRADLIEAASGRLDPAAFDKYIRMAGGLQPHLTGCVEDSLEACANIGRHLCGLARQQLGARADGVVNESLRPYVDKVEVQNPPDFSPEAWVQQWH